MRPLVDVLTEHHVDLSTEWGQSLLRALYAREDAVADALRQIAAQTGAHPPIVAEVLTNSVLLGTPADEATKEFVRANFLVHVDELRRQQGDQ